jgi:hypothetical protein
MPLVLDASKIENEVVNFLTPPILNQTNSQEHNDISKKSNAERKKVRKVA